jgi:hypothetical protein
MAMLVPTQAASGSARAVATMSRPFTMKLPYYYTFTLHSPLSIAELKAALLANSAPGWQPRATAKPTAAGFDARYAPHVADTSLRKYQLLKVVDPATGARLYPKCYLRAEERGTYCRVQLKFRPVLFLSIFMTIWSSGVLLATFGIGSETLRHHPEQAGFLLIFLPFYLGFWFFHWATFSSLVPAYRQRLCEILAATDADGPLPLPGRRPQPPGLARPGTGPTFAP